MYNYKCRKWFLQKVGHEGIILLLVFISYILIIDYLALSPSLGFHRLTFFFIGLNNLLMAYADKSAFALCVFSLVLGPNAEPITFSGKTPVCFLLVSTLYILLFFC